MHLLFSTYQVCHNHSQNESPDQEQQNESELCLVSTKYNKHGTIYIVGPPSSFANTIYKGKDGDAILEYWDGCVERGSIVCPAPPREYGTWKKTSQYYLFNFPTGRLYVPIR